jgi:3'-phosphoadenosine 5'-phosphosulfate sulfotransferase (PAPS reductase)/FAD synthetase
MKQYLMCSGGKDSMASAILCYKKGIHLDGIVTAEIMFSHEKNISAEYPDHIKWFYEIAKPTLEEQFGYKVIVLKSKVDYVAHFNGRVTERTKYPERIGKKRGFVLGGNMCALKRDCKVKVLNDWCKAQGEVIKILGIAYDEEERLASLHKQKNAWSILETEKVTEAQTYDICREYNLLSPYYSSGRSRQGCWFCPNARIEEMADFAKKYPEYWSELRAMAQDEETVSKVFKYTRTFESVDREISLINNQISVFDLL